MVSDVSVMVTAVPNVFGEFKKDQPRKATKIISPIIIKFFVLSFIFFLLLVILSLTILVEFEKKAGPMLIVLL